MLEEKLEIVNKLGLHARAASKLATLCAKYSSKILVHKNSQKADGKSIMSLMLLAAGKGAFIDVNCTGDDEAAAMAAIAALIANRFDEAE
jgi:phosphocarrier protein HPr